MVLPLHLGIEHPNLVWIAASAILAFIAGLAVNLYRSVRAEARRSATPVPEEKTE